MVILHSPTGLRFHTRYPCRGVLSRGPAATGRATLEGLSGGGGRQLPEWRVISTGLASKLIQFRGLDAGPAEREPGSEL